MTLDFKAPARKRALVAWAKKSNIDPFLYREVSFIPYVGLAARNLLRIFQGVNFLPQTGRFDIATLKLLMPPTYKKLYPAVGIEPGHIPGWNKSSLLITGSEGAIVAIIARELTDELRRRGIRVIRNPLNYDLGPSVRMLALKLPKGSLAVELHTNGGGAAQRGFLAIYSPWMPKSLAAASRISRAVKKSGIMPLASGGLLKSSVVALWNGFRSGDIGWTAVMRRAGMIPVMPECGFHTNKADVAVLNDKKRRAQLVKAIADGIAPPA